MIAYRFAPGSSKPAREEVSVPHPKPNEVLVKILAGGVCHSDVGVLDPDHNLSTVSNNHYTLGKRICQSFAWPPLTPYRRT